MTESDAPMLVALACDHAGVALKEQLKPLFQQLGAHVEDFGTHGPQSIDYPDYAHAVARAIAEQRFARGVLICGTGIGMCITANRHAGVRAAVCNDSYSARMTRMHNDANVLCLGARVIGLGVAEEVVRVFFGTRFEGGRHGGRVAKIEAV